MLSTVVRGWGNVRSPNAEEALKLLSLPFQLTRSNIEQAGRMFLEYGVGMDGQGVVIIRSGQLGAFVITRRRCGAWVDAYWTKSEADTQHVVDVTGMSFTFCWSGHLSQLLLNTGAGNSFLGGLAAGLFQTEGDVYEGKLRRTLWEDVRPNMNSSNALRHNFSFFRHRTRRFAAYDIESPKLQLADVERWFPSEAACWPAYKTRQVEWKYGYRRCLKSTWLEMVVHCSDNHCWVDWNLARLAANSSSCLARSSSSVIPDCSNLETFFSRSWWKGMSRNIIWFNRSGTDFLLLFVIFEHILDLSGEGFKTQSLVRCDVKCSPEMR